MFVTLRLLNLFALLGAVAWLASAPDWEPGVTAIGLFAGLLGQEFVAARARDGRDDNSPDSVIRTFEGRREYFDEVLSEVERADRDILLFVHSLDPAESDNPISKLHHALNERRKAGVSIRMIAPAGAGRAKASYQLTSNCELDVRHLDALEDVDISFSVFDSVRSVLPLRSSSSDESTNGVTIQSNKLGDLLTVCFREFWCRPDAMNYQTFLRATARRYYESVSTVDRDVLAEHLGVPPPEIDRLCPSLGRNGSANVLFVVGRPCSGKTTVIDKLQRLLARKGVPQKEVFVFNDYKVLHNRFSDDFYLDPFTEAPRGGFEIVDPHQSPLLDSVLDEANGELLAARPFFKVAVAEFARRQYSHSLSRFDAELLRHCTILHVKCSVETCLRRNDKRRHTTAGGRRGYVPPDVITGYYGQEDVIGLDSFPDTLMVTIDTEETDEHEIEEELKQVVDRLLQ